MKMKFCFFKRYWIASLAMLSFAMTQLRATSDIEKAIIEDKLSAFEGLKMVYDKNAPAVVKVIAARKDESGKQFLVVGSGFFIDKEGYLITNATIVYKAENLWIDSRGAPSKATLIGFDPITNISVLKAETNGIEPAVVDLETSSALPEIAEALLMVSCELGQDISPNLGFITGHNIRFGDKVLPTVYLRTSIPIYGGSVGAPLFSLKGEFKGIAVAALPELGGSFVLPARAVNRVKDDIMLAQKVSYGWFGLVSREIADNINGVRVIVDIVVPESPASKAGFEVGDVILAINGKNVETDKDLRWETFFVRAGELARFKVRRQDKELNMEMQVGRVNSEAIEKEKTSLEITFKSSIRTEEAKAE